MYAKTMLHRLSFPYPLHLFRQLLGFAWAEAQHTV